MKILLNNQEYIAMYAVKKAGKIKYKGITENNEIIDLTNLVKKYLPNRNNSKWRKFIWKIQILCKQLLTI